MAGLPEEVIALVSRSSSQGQTLCTATIFGWTVILFATRRLIG
jgi:hypothetical protein